MPLSSRAAARAAFQYPNFRFYMTARFLTVLSTEMQAVAVAWQIYGLTHQPLDLGLVGLAQFAPGVLLFLVAGHTADRVPRLRIIRTCYVAFSLCSALLLALSLHGLVSVWPIYAVLLGNGVARAFNGPAGQAFLPLLVSEEHFPNAVTWSSSIFQAATVLGPTAGGVIYGLAQTPVPVYCCAAAGYLTAVLLVLRVRLESAVRPRAASTSVQVLEGLRYIWQNKLILGSISLDLFAVLLGGAVALLPVYARDILNAGTYGLGLLRSAPGAGAVLMALLLAYRPLRRRAGLTLFACVFGFGVFTVIFGVSHSIAISLVALALLGACDMVSVIVRHTLVQLTTPDAMRGRVSAVNMLFIGASNEVGQFESGMTAQWFGTVPAVVLGGLGTIAVVLLWSWMFPSLRRVDSMAPEPLLSSRTPERRRTAL
ncbi:MAG TPA: MFS transporter [Bryobacteraceae bacterium]|nr:MFS transporter [Bryobacteraceae bacterium]